jgi:hypothetical protein
MSPESSLAVIPGFAGPPPGLANLIGLLIGPRESMEVPPAGLVLIGTQIGTYQS